MAPSTRSRTPAAEPTTDGGPIKRVLSRSRTREDIFDAKYAVDLATTTIDENVFLFVPNMIGYSRVILAGAAFVFMPYHPKLCTLLYTISCLLDALDGQAARALGQTSKFGAVLDMVTDRCTTSCLLCFLSKVYPSYSLLFMFLISLDFSSHYIHMYSSLLTGSSSHKTVTSDVSRILWYYYNDSRTLFIFCFVNELFFVCLYLNAFLRTPLAPQFPVSALLSSSLAAQYPKAVASLIWAIRHVTLPQVVGALSFPICAGKQIINVVQFWKASKIIVGVDLAERQAARESKLSTIKEGKAL